MSGVDLEHLLEACVSYLREIEVFRGEPIESLFSESRTRRDFSYGLSPNDPRNIAFESVDVHENEFNLLVGGIPYWDFDSVQWWIKSTILAQGGNSTIIELGSEYGNVGVGALAPSLPDSRFILVSDGRKMDSRDDLFNRMFWQPKHSIIFPGEARAIMEIGDVKERVEALYRFVGIDNVEFYDHVLRRGQFPEFLDGISGDIIVVAYNAPRNLSFLAAELYEELGARLFCVSPNALELITPKSFVWDLVRKTLNLSESELEGLKLSALDKEGSYRVSKGREPYPGFNHPRYEYNFKEQNPGQMRIGESIKLAFVLTLANFIGFQDVDIFRKSDKFMPCYNQAGYYLRATRN